MAFCCCLSCGRHMDCTGEELCDLCEIDRLTRERDAALLRRLEERERQLRKRRARANS